ncbi:MAG: radical SAM protein [Clostridiales bacterium]|nr:radical SAM protein [Clostridiales bacterium]
MNAKEKAQRALASVAIDRVLRYIDKDPEKNLIRLIDRAQRLTGGVFPQKNFDAFRNAVSDPENVWSHFARSMLDTVSHDLLKKLLLSFGLGTYTGTKAVRANRVKYGCNIPYIILLDPTSACNKNCKGCWSAEYGHKYNLTYDEMDDIVNQGVKLGTHLYMLTGGEPLIRKNDILKLCAAHPDCMFLAYTNATLVDEKFIEEMNSLGNLSLALSIEGTEETNDSRRGEGSYKTTIEVMELLKAHKSFFGISVCYTSANVPEVTSDEFMDKMIEGGAKFGLYFNYMPIGSDAVVSLIPSPEQRKYMYKWVRKTRNGKTGKPMFVMDFQDDGEYVGGCIAGGRNYFHINSNGDIEPCVFVHYSDSNIRSDTLLDALKKPLFMAYYRNQPFNDNHLRPCPLLENPDRLRKMISETGARSTDLLAPEDVETLCSRCDRFAAEWAPVAKELWNTTPHPDPKTQYYRDTPEGKARNSGY